MSRNVQRTIRVTMTRYLFSILILNLSLASADSASAEDRPAEQPNVVLIFADDLGYGDLGCYDDEQIGTVLREKAVDWITEKKDKPFFLYLATTNIHHPFTPAPRFKDTSQAGLYGDFIHELDWMVGEITACLEKNGLSENTLVIFTGDNGGMLNFTGSKPSDHAWGGAPTAAFAGSVNSNIADAKIKKDAPPAQLYDLENDVNQTKNLYREYPEVVKEMQALLNSYLPAKQRNGKRK